MKKDLSERLTKYSKISLYAVFGVCLVLLGFSAFSMSDNYSCQESTGTSSSCDEYHEKINCRTTVATPLNFAITANIGSIQVQYTAECAWDAALSEVRVVFAFIAIAVAYLGYAAIVQQEKERATIFIYASFLTSALFLISAFADMSEIIGSQNDNENLCTLKGRYRVPETIKLISFECSFTRYYLTVLLSILCGGALVTAGYFVQRWQRALPKPT